MNPCVQNPQLHCIGNTNSPWDAAFLIVAGILFAAEVIWIATMIYRDLRNG